MLFRASPPAIVYLYLILYFSVIGSLIIRSNFLIMWLLIESSSLLFMGVAFSGSGYPLIYVMGYYIVQSIASAILLMPYGLFYCYPFLSLLTLQVLIFVKLAIYPLFI